MLAGEYFPHIGGLVLDGKNTNIGIQHELEHLKSFPFLLSRLLALRHEVCGDHRGIKPAVPELTCRGNDSGSTKRDHIDALYVIWKGYSFRQANGLAPVTLKNSTLFHTVLLGIYI